MTPHPLSIPAWRGPIQKGRWEEGRGKNSFYKIILVFKVCLNPYFFSPFQYLAYITMPIIFIIQIKSHKFSGTAGVITFSKNFGFVSQAYH